MPQSSSLYTPLPSPSALPLLSCQLLLNSISPKTRLTRSSLSLWGLLLLLLCAWHFGPHTHTPAPTIKSRSQRRSLWEREGEREWASEAGSVCCVNNNNKVNELAALDEQVHACKYGYVCECVCLSVCVCICVCANCWWLRQLTNSGRVVPLPPPAPPSRGTGIAGWHQTHVPLAVPPRPPRQMLSSCSQQSFSCRSSHLASSLDYASVPLGFTSALGLVVAR